MVRRSRDLVCLLAAAVGACGARVSVVPHAPPPIRTPSHPLSSSAGLAHMPSRRVERVVPPIAGEGLCAGGDCGAARMPLVAPAISDDARSAEAKLMEILGRPEESVDAAAWDKRKVDEFNPGSSSSSARMHRRGILNVIFGSSVLAIQPAIAADAPPSPATQIVGKTIAQKEEKPLSTPVLKPPPRNEDKPEVEKEEKKVAGKEEKIEGKPPSQAIPKPVATKEEKANLLQLSEKNLVDLPEEIDALREMRDKLANRIKKEQEAKTKLNDEMLAIESSIKKLVITRNELDEDIAESEAKLFKLLDSSAALLKSVKIKALESDIKPALNIGFRRGLK